MKTIAIGKKKFLILLFCVIVSLSCGPFEVLDSVSEEIEVAEILTKSVPSSVKETAVPTPRPGDFGDPAHIGESVSRYESEQMDYAVEATLLDVKRGAEAQELAESLLDPLGYENPRPMFEYLALKVRLVVLDSVEGTDYSLYLIDHFGLRNDEKAYLLWSVDTPARFLPEYSPVYGEGWIFFIVNENYTPYLYFQPFLSLDFYPETENSSAYFVLD